MRTEVLIVATLVALVAPVAAPAQQAGDAPPEARQIEVEILGMSCPFCAYGVEQKLKRLDGVEDLDVQLRTGIATLELAEGADIPNERLIETVREAGFEVVAIRRTFESEYPDVTDEEGG